MMPVIAMMSIIAMVMVMIEKMVIKRTVSIAMIKWVIIEWFPKIIAVINTNTTMQWIARIPKRIGEIIVVIAKAKARTMKTSNS
jgi:hypothetical protein